MTNWAAGMEITSARLTDATKNDQQAFTPSFGGLGTGTYSTQTGWYYLIGKLCFFDAYIVINANGSGAANLTLQGPPLNIDRNARQAVLFSATAFGGGNGIRAGMATSFTGGSGSVWDAIYTTQNTVDDMVRLTGTLVPGGAICTIQGFYLTT